MVSPTASQSLPQHQPLPPLSPNPVVLVHGMWDTHRVFDPMAQQLRSLGWQVYSFDMVPSNGDAPLEVLAQQLADFINRTFAATEPIDLVGFSMGGIVSRYYLQRLGGLNRVQRLITISSPHKGTIAGFFSHRPGARQMQVRSAWIADLNQDCDRLAQLNFTSIWTPWDALILPAWSSHLDCAKAVQIPGLLHAWMVKDPRVIQTVIQALQEPISRQISIQDDRRFDDNPAPQKSLQNASNI
ncbi:MAG: triacylglycerol lipase [Synechococcales bacterium]|nr:triacylglycerol lipase [Synechococcales bacterium]